MTSSGRHAVNVLSTTFDNSVVAIATSMTSLVLKQDRPYRVIENLLEHGQFFIDFIN